MTTLAQQGQQRPCNVGNGVSAIRATMPSWKWQRRLRIDDGNDAIVTRATTPAWRWQQCHHSKGNKDIVTMAKNACASMMTTPSQWEWWPQLNNSKDACASMTTTTPLLQGQWCQLNDYASLITAETPLQEGQQLPLQWQQRHLRINDNNTMATRAAMPSWWWQGYLCINNDNDAIATKVTTPAWGWQQRPHKEGNNTIADQGQWCHSYKGNNASSMTARTPAHWQWWWNYCHEGNNCNWDYRKDTCASTAMVPSQQGQHCQLNDKQQGQQR
jgi:hypothetical protein